MADIYAGGDETFDYNSADADFEKPTWNDDIDITDIVPPSPKPEASSKKSKKKKKNKDAVSDDDLGVDVSDMDADAEPSSSKKRKRALNEEERNALAELDEMDFTSLAGGLPTRFKYTPVLPDNFGLTPVEILLADDAELNEYVGLKKLAPYRRGKDGKTKSGWDKGRGERLKEFKRKLNEKWGSVAETASGGAGKGEDGERPAKKRKGKKERQKEKMAAAQVDDNDGNADGELEEDRQDTLEQATEDGQEHTVDGACSSRKRRRKHKKASQTVAS